MTKERKANAAMWNVEARNTVSGAVRTVAAGFLSEGEAHAYADKKSKWDVWEIEKFYVVRIK